MRRLVTALILVVVLLLIVAVASVAPAQTTGAHIFGRRDTANNVICYQARAESDYLSCVYVPPDGTQVNLPRGEGGTT